MWHFEVIILFPLRNILIEFLSFWGTPLSINQCIAACSLRITERKYKIYLPFKRVEFICLIQFLFKNTLFFPKLFQFLKILHDSIQVTAWIPSQIMLTVPSDGYKKDICAPLWTADVRKLKNRFIFFVEHSKKLLTSCASENTRFSCNISVSTTVVMVMT